MGRRSLLNKAKISEFQKGIFDNVYITNIDIKDRKGKNGPINKIIYIKFVQVNSEGKRTAESELSWWKPDITNDYFKTNFQEMCLQLHNIVEAYIGEDKAFDAFSSVFKDLDIKSHEELEDRKWKLSEFNTIVNNLKESFEKIISPFINDVEKPIRLKLTTNYKGEDIEIPKYGKFVESMSLEKSDLKFSVSELKTHSKAGNVDTDVVGASSTNTNSTI